MERGSTLALNLQCRDANLAVNGRSNCSDCSDCGVRRDSPESRFISRNAVTTSSGEGFFPLPPAERAREEFRSVVGLEVLLAGRGARRRRRHGLWRSGKAVDFPNCGLAAGRGLLVRVTRSFESSAGNGAAARSHSGKKAGDTARSASRASHKNKRVGTGTHEAEEGVLFGIDNDADMARAKQSGPPGWGARTRVKFVLPIVEFRVK